MALILTALGVASQYGAFTAELQDQVFETTKSNLSQVAESVQQVPPVIENHTDSKLPQPSQQAVASISKVRPPIAAWKIVLITLVVLVLLVVTAVVAYNIYKQRQMELQVAFERERNRKWLEAHKDEIYARELEIAQRERFLNMVPLAIKLVFAVGLIYVAVDYFYLSKAICGLGGGSLLVKIFPYRAYIASGVALIASLVMAVAIPSWIIGIIPIFAAAVVPLLILQGFLSTGVGRWLLFLTGLISFAFLLFWMFFFPLLVSSYFYERDYNGLG